MTRYERTTGMSSHIDRPRGRRIIVAWSTIIAIVALAASAASPAHAAGATPVRTEPVDGATVTAPSKVVVAFGAGDGVTAATADVFDVTRTSVASGPLVAQADGTTYGLAVPSLDDGLYTVVWKASVAGATATGTFAFDVDAESEPAAMVTGPEARFALKGTRDVVVSWLPWVSVMVLVGALLLRFLVTAPSAALIGDAEDRRRTIGNGDRRLVRIAAAAGAVLLVSSVVEAAYDSGDGKRAAFGAIGKMLLADGAGHLRFARLVLAAVAVVVLVPVALRGRDMGEPTSSGRAMAVGATLGLLEMLARVAPARMPLNKPRTFLGDVFTFGHIAGAALWIGGLVGLAALAMPGAVPAPARSTFWPRAVARFSTVALSCVAAVALSGMWLSWVHVASLSQLAHTLYGRTLLVKLALVGVLVALGGVNHLWLKPRLTAAGAGEQDGGVVRLVHGHLRRVVAVEVLVALGVLAVVPYLAGSARNQAFQTEAADLTLTAVTGDRTVTLRPSGRQAGPATYDVALARPASDVQLVFSSTELGVPDRTVPTAPRPDGTYRATGLYTPVEGSWQAGVLVDGQPASSFRLAVTAKTATLPRAPAPPITKGTWAFFALVTVAVLGALSGAALTARAATRRRAIAMVPPATSDRPLIDLAGR